MRAAWKIVEENFHPSDIFGAQGHQFVLTHSVHSSSHPFVVGMTFLASQAALMNGSAVDIFPDTQSPLNATAVLVNYPQTRKSQNTKLCKVLSEQLDKALLSKAESMLRRPEVAHEGRGRRGASEDSPDGRQSSHGCAWPALPSPASRQKSSSSEWRATSSRSRMSGS